MAFWNRASANPPPFPPDPRYALGRRGEEEGARYLRKRGYEIIARNVRTRLGEIDLIARHRGVLVFVDSALHEGPDQAGVEWRCQAGGQKLKRHRRMASPTSRSKRPKQRSADWGWMILWKWSSGYTISGDGQLGRSSMLAMRRFTD